MTPHIAEVLCVSNFKQRILSSTVMKRSQIDSKGLVPYLIRLFTQPFNTVNCTLSLETPERKPNASGHSAYLIE